MAPPIAPNDYDVIVVGAGHNGLVSAALLARAGMSVLVLERLPEVGGASVSVQSFPGVDVRLSRYSYLVSLMPEELMADLGLDVRLVSRSTASCTPYVRDGRHGALLVERPESERTRASFRELTGGDEEYAAWQAFYAEVGTLAAQVAPTLLQPLPKERDISSAVDPDLWRDLVVEPLGAALERRFTDDTVRGVVATDALIGTFASLHDPSLVQNRCFLYHLVGNGTGEWRVPVGGMGAVSGALAKAASGAGAEIRTRAGVSRIEASADGAEVLWDEDGQQRSATCRHVLAGVAPWVLQILLDGGEEPETKPVGSQLKMNMVLDRLPALRSGIDPEVAFAGTLHLAEDYSHLEAAYARAAAGALPDVLPGEVYCHSLTDPSILGSLAGTGAHTLTYFGVHTPETLFAEDPARVKEAAVERAIASLDAHLAEPLADCLARDSEGNPLLEAKIPQELEAELAMPGGHIFHGDLDWPWAANRALLDTPQRRWGVATDLDPVLLCGSGARRGGAVSGIAGHNAAQAVLESR